MPAVALIPAVFAGVQIATVGIAAMSTMAVIGAVGAIAAGVGVVTGNKALTQIGAVAGLVGGVGAFAQGQGWLAGGASGGEGIAAEGLAGDYVNQMDMASDAASATSEAISAAAPGVANPTAGLVTDPSAAGYTNQMDLASDAAGMSGSGSSAVESAASAAGGSGGGGLVNSGVNGSDRMSDQFAGKGAGGFGATSTSSGIFDTLKGVGSFLKDNKEIAALGLNFLGGMTDGKKAAEEDLLKAKLGEVDATVGLYKARTSGEMLNQEQQRQQMANANSVPDMTGLKLKPGSVYNTAPPPVYRAPRPGLINSTGR